MVVAGRVWYVPVELRSLGISVVALKCSSPKLVAKLSSGATPTYTREVIGIGSSYANSSLPGAANLVASLDGDDLASRLDGPDYNPVGEDEQSCLDRKKPSAVQKVGTG